MLYDARKPYNHAPPYYFKVTLVPATAHLYRQALLQVFIVGTGLEKRFDYLSMTGKISTLGPFKNDVTGIGGKGFTRIGDKKIGGGGTDR